MSDDDKTLVERLWLAKLREQDGRESMLPQQAAARIEAQAAEIERLRAVVANMANTINIVGSDYDQTIKALDRLVLSVKSQARAALAGKAEQ